MSLTREALDKWLDYARRDLESAPPDGMLVYLMDKANLKYFESQDVAVIAVAYYKAMIEYTRT
jgi:hypothetical protein